MCKKPIAFGLLSLLVMSLIGCAGRKLRTGQPIIISDDWLKFKSTGVAFNSWPPGPGVQTIYPSFPYNGVSVKVDDIAVKGCPSSANTCKISIVWENPAKPTIFVQFDRTASANKMLALASEKPFTLYTGYASKEMKHPDLPPSKRITQLDVVVDGAPVLGSPYKPKKTCKITVN